MHLRILVVFILLLPATIAWSESHLDIITGTGQVIRQAAYTEGDFVSREAVGEYYLISEGKNANKLKFVSLKDPNNIDPNLTIIELELGEVDKGGIGMTSRMVDITDSKSFDGLKKKLAKIARTKGISFKTGKKLALLHQIQIQNNMKSDSLLPRELDSLKRAKKIKMEIERKGNDFAVLLTWPNCQDPINIDISGGCSGMEGDDFHHYIIPWED